MIFDARRPVLITGGAGFIGTNVAERLLSAGQPVVIFDSLARAGVAHNLAWLRQRHGAKLEVVLADIRDAAALRRAVRRACRVFHFAAQVAVTTSLTDPLADFEVNARGTLNLLEAIRSVPQPPPLLFTSTNKVYGTLAAVDVGLVGDRYLPRDETLRQHGVDERQPLDFHSPYGCSKGAADQYVLDYARIYGLPALVFRMSCIYGPHQRGNEDQGWVAHFLLAILQNEPITIYGDGHQVRDALYADDLVDAMLTAHRHIDHLAGRAFNIGGGVENTITLHDLLDLGKALHGQLPAVRHGAWRTADQRYYVSRIDAFSQETGWRPRVSVAEGVARLFHQLRDRLHEGAPAVEPMQVAAGQG
jgi:CDP-paratose 2-epimerase